VSESASSGSGAFNLDVHGLRGVAAFLVFVGHLTAGLALHIYTSNFAFVNLAKYVVNFGTYSVELFFIISGYVISGSVKKYSVKVFFERRFLRIYPLFAFFTLLFFVANYLFSIEPEKRSFLNLVLSLTFTDLFTDRGGLSPNAWSVSYEMWYYAFCAAGFFVFTRTSVAPKVIVVIAALVFLLKFPISLYFISGIAIYHIQSQRPGVGRNYYGLIQLGSLALIVALASSHKTDYASADIYRWQTWVLFLAASLFIFSITGGKNPASEFLRSKAVTRLGTISFSFYLSHPYSYFVMRFVLVKLGVFSLPMFPALVISYFSMTVLAVFVAALVYATIERGAYEHYFKRKIYNVQTSVVHN
jgi:peptidoglycan/LPS O-acetylase OafA/YrhL